MIEVEHSATLNGLQLFWRSTGSTDAPPVMLLHGAWGQSQYWTPLMGELGESHHVLALDQRGHGESEWAGEGGYRLEDFAADLSALREGLGWDRFRLIGLSLGGLVAMTYAARASEHLDALMMVDIGPEIASDAGAAMQAAPPYPESFVSLDAAVAWARGDPLWGDSPGLRDDVALRLREQDDGQWRWRADPSCWRERQRSRWTGADERWAAFAGIGCPVTLVRAGRDSLVDDGIAARMHEAQPGIDIIDVPNAGHSVPRDAPEAFAQIARAFCAVDD